MVGLVAAIPSPTTPDNCLPNFSVDKTPLRCLEILEAVELNHFIFLILEAHHLVQVDLILGCFLVAVVLKEWTSLRVERLGLVATSSKTHQLNMH